MKKITLLILTFAASLLSAENVLACTCGHPQIDTEEKFRAAVATAVNGADAIFSGKVVEMDSLTVKFKLEKVWKGNFKDANELTLLTGAVLTKDGRYKSTTCEYDFEVGEKYLVFGRGSEAKLTASKCSWTHILGKRKRFVNELDRLKQLDPGSESLKAMADLFHMRRNLTSACSGSESISPSSTTRRTMHLSPGR